MVEVPEAAVHWLSGLAGGTAQVLVGHPFDTIKVRLQTSNEYEGAMDCLKRTVRTESPWGLYKGVGTPLLGVGLCNAVMFSANGLFRRLLRTDGEASLSLGRLSLAGGLAGSVMALLNCPIELIKVRLQVQTGARKPLYRNFVDCARKTFASEGLIGLYRGFGMTLARDFPSYAGYFFVYEGSKSVLAAWQAQPESMVPAWQLMLCGGFAGFGAWIPAYPQDVLKSRMQVTPGIGTVEALKLLLMEGGGVRGLFRGFAPTMARAFPANAATFLAYEAAQEHLLRL